MNESSNSELSNKVNCPYCGHLIDNDVEMCPNCNERFSEPHLDNFHMRSIESFILLSILTLGIYNIIWVFINYNAFKSIASPKDITKLTTLSISAISFLLLIGLTPWVFVLYLILLILLSYRLLRVIEKFAYRKYNSPITHHEFGMIVFSILYVVYFIDTFAQRVNDPTLRYCLEKGEWVKYIIIFLIVILSIIGISFIYNFNF